MPVTKTGNWRALSRLAAKPDEKIRRAIRGATLRAALLLVREIKRGIVSQAPGGKQFAPLAESTIKYKGSSKALIDKGFLLNAVTQKIMDDSAFVGLLRSSVRNDGESNANVAAIMEYGATVTMPNGTTIIIPARPFLGPTMEAQRKAIIGFYRAALKSCLPV